MTEKEFYLNAIMEVADHLDMQTIFLMYEIAMEASEDAEKQV